MNNVIPLTFRKEDVRLLEIDGQLWWVATDIAKILGYRNAADMTRNLDRDEKGTHVLRTLGGNRKVSVISESGLYAAIFKSERAEAKRFRRWVTGKVLPSIRKYGCYPAPQAIKYDDDPISNHEQTTLPQRFKQERLRWEAAENLSLADIPSMSKNIITAIESGMGGITKGKRMQYLLYAGIDVLYIMTGRRTLTMAERAVRDAMRNGDDDVRAILYARALQITN